MSKEELMQKVEAFKMEIAGIDEIQMTDVIEAICKGKYVVSPVYYFARVCAASSAEKAIISLKGDKIGFELKAAKSGTIKLGKK